MLSGSIPSSLKWTLAPFDVPWHVSDFVPAPRPVEVELVGPVFFVVIIERKKYGCRVDCGGG